MSDSHNKSKFLWVVNNVNKPFDFEHVFEEYDSAASYVDDIGLKDLSIIAICKSGLDDFISEYYKDRRAWHNNKQEEEPGWKMNFSNNDNSILERQIENETNRLFYLNREKQMAEEKAREVGNIDPTEALYQICRANAITKISKRGS